MFLSNIKTFYLLDYNTLHVECFILNDPLKREIDLENLIKKIELSKYNIKQKILFNYYKYR